ncbi:hypothetical protein Tco_1219930 [Tanacetum coccineum]
MLKTGQRARSSAGRDPGHLLSSEIYRWRPPRLESARCSSRPTSTHIIMAANLRKMRREFRGVDPAEGSRRQYTDGCAPRRGPNNRHVRKGKQRGHIPGVGRVLAGQGRDAISINEPRCTHTHADVDEVKEDNKRLRKELAMLWTVMRSDDQMSQLLT